MFCVGLDWSWQNFADFKRYLASFGRFFAWRFVLGDIGYLQITAQSRRQYPSKIVPKSGVGALRKAAGATLGSRNAFWEQPVLSIFFIFEFRRFWSPFGAQLGSRGVPKFRILIQSQNKIINNSVQKMSQKKSWDVYRLWIKNQAVSRAPSLRKSCFIAWKWFLAICEHFKTFIENGI